MFEYYITRLEKYKRSVFFIVVSLYSALSLFCYDINLASSFREFFDDKNNKVEIFDAMETVFNKQDSIVIHVRSKEGSIFNPRTLALIYDLTEESWSIPHSIRVDSLSNYQNTLVSGDDLSVNFLIEDKLLLEDPEKILEIKKTSEETDSIQNVLVAKDHSSSIISITVNREDNNKLINAEIYSSVQVILSKYIDKNKDHEIALSGSVSSSAAITKAMKSDLSIISAATLLVISILLAILLKTFSGVLIVITISLLSITATFGLFSLLGVTITPTHAFAPTAICTIAVADLVHLLSTYYHQIHLGSKKNTAIRYSLEQNWKPILITTISTIVGALCLNSSDSPPYQTLGNMIAFGVFSAYILSILLVPIILSWLSLPARYRTRDTAFQSVSVKLSKQIIVHRKAITLTLLICCIFNGFLISKNKVTERWYEYFGADTSFSTAINELNNVYSGIHKIVYTVRSKEGEFGINAPAYLAELDLFADWLRSQEKVGFVDTHTTTLKKINQDLHGGDSNYSTIPSDKQSVAQYLLLYEMSLPVGLGLDNIQNSDQSASKLTVILHKMDSQEIIDFDNKAVSWLNNNSDFLSVDEGTGMDIIFSHLSSNNIKDIIGGSILGLILIALILCYALKSFKLGLVSLIPNLLPLLIAYGLWGLVDGKISIAASVVMSISLGIIVDDTVHFLSKYQYARSSLHYAPDKAIEYVFQTVGPALLITTIVLVSGFMLMLMASFTPSQSMGVLLSLVLSTALIIDFLLLPALMLFLEPAHRNHYQDLALETSNE